MSSIANLALSFTDTDGTPLEGGSIYIGTINLNPETNPIAVYWDAALTQGAAQPIKTSGGMTVHNGNVSNIFAATAYSITVRNSNGDLVYYIPDSSDITKQTTFANGVEADLASATTIDLGGQSTDFLRITGTTTIASFGTTYNGPVFMRFASALTITYNSTSLITPNGIDLVVAAGDTAIAWPKATAGVQDGWEVSSYGAKLREIESDVVVLQNDSLGYIDVIAVASATTLDSSYAGKLVIVNSTTPFSIALPTASTVSLGNTIAFLDQGTGGITYTRQGADTFKTSGGPLTSYVTGYGEFLVFTKTEASVWSLSGSATLKDQEQFDQSLTATGDKTLPGHPNDMLMKWGQVTGNGGVNQNITFATAFPNACLAIVGIAGSTAATGAEAFELVSLSASVAVVDVSGTSVGRWFAIGY